MSIYPPELPCSSTPTPSATPPSRSAPKPDTAAEAATPLASFLEGRFVAVRENLIAVCKGDYCAAAILGRMAEWHDFKSRSAAASERTKSTGGAPASGEAVSFGPGRPSHNPTSPW
ncbi:MAG: hypothetical protein M3Y56_14410, partial [Armatimonadota bacterium]|nr:hypothetical protein [Armatimonadota bacterium]